MLAWFAVGSSFVQSQAAVALVAEVGAVVAEPQKVFAGLPVAACWIEISGVEFPAAGFPSLNTRLPSLVRSVLPSAHEQQPYPRPADEQR